MLRLRLPDGSAFEAVDAIDALRQLNARSLSPQADIWRFMTGWAGRMRRLGGRQVRCGSPGLFLTDLARLGWIELEGDPLATGPDDGLFEAESAEPER